MDYKRRSTLVTQAGAVNDLLARERKYIEFYLLKSVNLNFRDNFSTPDRTLYGKSWRAGDIELSERQLYARWSQYLNEELGGSIADVCYAEIPSLREQFCAWLVYKNAGYSSIVNEHKYFKRDLETLIAAHLNDALFQSFKSGSAGSYLALMSESAIFSLITWGTMRAMRSFAHEAQNRASKYAKLTEGSERVMSAVLEDTKERMREVAVSPLQALMGLWSRIKKTEGESEDVKPIGTSL